MNATLPIRRRDRRVHRWLGLGAVLTITLAACGSGDDDDASSESGDDTAATSPADTEEPTGDAENADDADDVEDAGDDSATDEDARELIIARDMDLTTLDPQRAYCDTCQIYLTAAYETLIGVDPGDPTQLVPRIAESWTANDDNTEFTFELDPDATFADGSPITASDVKFSWERLANLQDSASYLMGGYESIDTPDDHTVVVTFGAPNSAFLKIASASYLGIVNADVAAENGATADADAASTDNAEQWFLSNSAGSGPFVLESYTEGDSLVLARNDNYWGEPTPFPRVTINQVKDSTAQLQQLQQGDVDIAMQISFDSLGQLEGTPDVSTDLVDSFNFVYVAFSPGAVGGEAMQDPRVREAMKKALDFEGIVDVTVGGNGKLQASPIPNGFEGSDGLPLPEQDLEGARALLDEAGVDGLSFEAAYPAVNVYGVDFDTMMQKVQQDLAEIDIELDLQPVEFPQWVERIQGDGIPVTAVYFAPDHIDSSQYVQYFGMIEDSAWLARAGSEPSAEQQAMYADVLAASGDAKTALYSELGQAMSDDTIIVPLVNPQLVLAYASDVTDMHYSACCNLELGRLGIG